MSRQLSDPSNLVPADSSSSRLSLPRNPQSIMPLREGTYTVCVYGSSSVKTPKQYLEVARKLGNALADGGHVCVNGAGRAGCMGALNDGVTERCGRVRGVIHEMWIVDKSEHPEVKDLEVVRGEGLQERKRALQKSADCIIALPGGIGTWDELWEVVCLKGVGLYNVPICVLNVDDFYEGFKLQMARAQRDRLLYADAHKLVHFETDPLKALEWCVLQMKESNGVETPAQPLRRTRPKTSMLNLRVVSDHLAWVCCFLAVSSALYLASERFKC